MKYAAVLLVGLVAVEFPCLDRLGATLSWRAWAFKFDRAQLERNLGVLSAADIDYVRVLGSVDGASWEDRQTDPRWSDYDSIIAGMTDLAYDQKWHASLAELRPLGMRLSGKTTLLVALSSPGKGAASGDTFELSGYEELVIVGRGT